MPLISAGGGEAEKGVGLGTPVPRHPLVAATGNAYRPRNTLRLLNAHMRDEKPLGRAARQGLRPVAQRLNPEKLV